jgi:hypothetical protein
MSARYSWLHIEYLREKTDAGHNKYILYRNMQAYCGGGGGGGGLEEEAWFLRSLYVRAIERKRGEGEVVLIR